MNDPSCHSELSRAASKVGPHKHPPVQKRSEQAKHYAEGSPKEEAGESPAYEKREQQTGEA